MCGLSLGGECLNVFLTVFYAYLWLLEWILLQSLALKYDFIPYRLTYSLCMSIWIFKTCKCISVIQFVMLFLTKFLSVAYPGIFFGGGGSTNSVEDRTGIWGW